MRKFIMSAVAAVSMVFLAGPASAGSYWACQGGHVACGGGSAKAAKSYGAKSHKSAKRAKKKAYNAAYYDDAYAPAPKKAKKRSAKSYKKKGSSYAYSGGGGGYSGMASYYWQPQRVASGGWFNPNAMTAAHKTLPFGTKVRVTNARTGRSVVVTINDRGPYIKGRIIDLSRAAAGAIGMINSGVAPVKVAVLGR